MSVKGNAFDSSKEQGHETALESSSSRENENENAPTRWQQLWPSMAGKVDLKMLDGNDQHPFFKRTLC